MMKTLRHQWLQYAGLAASGLCLVHCLLMPFLIPLLPYLSAHTHGETSYEIYFIILVGLSTLTILSGYRHHKARRTLVLASSGFVLLSLSLFQPAPYLALALSIAGSISMLAAHFFNYKLCKSCPCPH